MRFLIVDDSKLARGKIAEYVKKLGSDVAGEAVDGVDGVKKFEELSPDFITMDFEMPNLNGIEAAKQILSLNFEAKIILITSIVDKKELMMAYKIGVRRVLQKPIGFDNFKSAIDELR